MPMRWLMTVREEGVRVTPPGWEASVLFDLSPRWIALDPAVGDEPPPNPNCFDALRRWPSVVEVRRPDGTRVSAELRPASVHFNFAYEVRNERDAAVRMRSPWGRQAALRGLSAADVPPGSEVWGEVNEEDFC